MNETERWLEIERFPDYLVSSFGRIMNRNTDTIKIPTANQQGIPNVLLMYDRQQFRRSVPLLVAHHFVPRRKYHFDTPINMDGDRFNNYWKNLDWRPRWFALVYHRQFKLPVPYGFDAGVVCMDTNTHFENIIDCAQEYGLIMKDIIHSCHTQTPVFPTWHTFAMI